MSGDHLVSSTCCPLSMFVMSCDNMGMEAILFFCVYLLLYVCWFAFVFDLYLCFSLCRRFYIYICFYFYMTYICVCVCVCVSVLLLVCVCVCVCVCVYLQQD